MKNVYFSNASMPHKTTNSHFNYTYSLMSYAYDSFHPEFLREYISAPHVHHATHSD